MARRPPRRPWRRGRPLRPALRLFETRAADIALTREAQSRWLTSSAGRSITNSRDSLKTALGCTPVCRGRVMAACAERRIRQGPALRPANPASELDSTTRLPRSRCVRRSASVMRATRAPTCDFVPPRGGSRPSSTAVPSQHAHNRIFSGPPALPKRPPLSANAPNPAECPRT